MRIRLVTQPPLLVPCIATHKMAKTCQKKKNSIELSFKYGEIVFFCLNKCTFMILDVPLSPKKKNMTLGIAAWHSAFLDAHSTQACPGENQRLRLLRGAKVFSNSYGTWMNNGNGPFIIFIEDLNIFKWI